LKTESKNRGQGGFGPMKKNDILRVRIDADTLTALKRICNECGCSLSHVLRESIAREISRLEGSPDALVPSTYGLSESTMRLSRDNREACARLLSSILIGQRSRRRLKAEQLQNREREVLQLLEALFCALCEPSAYARPARTPRDSHPTGLEATGMARPALSCVRRDDDLSVGSPNGARTHSSKASAAL
jgi:antitoxin component of RelBE/YafQ-DinJ toxin-antitoxin module